MATDTALSKSGDLERLSAVETLKGLNNPQDVKIAELVAYLESRDLWRQFAKITLGDLREVHAFQRHREEAEIMSSAKRRRGMLSDVVSGGSSDGDAKKVKKPEPPADGGMSTDDFARQVMPFVEGNGEVTLEDIAEYTGLDKKVLRHHCGALVKQGMLERIGVGRHAVYSSLA